MGLGYKGTNSYNEMDGNGWETAENGERRQQLDRAETSPTVGWTGGPTTEWKGRLECRAGAGNGPRFSPGHVPGEPNQLR